MKVNKKSTKKMGAKAVWKPKAKMIKLLEVVADPYEQPTITNWCDKTNIDRKTYYKWFKNEDFLKWWNEEWKEAMRKNEHYLDNIGLKRAAFDFKYWQAMQQKLYGFVPQSRVINENEVDLSKLDEKELEELKNKLDKVTITK